MKKFILSMVSVFVFQHLSASHNFYLGANLGFNYLSGKRSEYVINDNQVKGSLSDGKTVSVNNAYGGIFLGYLFRFHNFGFGPEFFYNYGRIENTISAKYEDPGNTSTTFDIKHRITANKGFNFRSGYFLESYFLYFLFGVNWQTSKYWVMARQTVVGVGDITEYQCNMPHKVTLGCSIGLGIQKQINEKYDIGLEYKLTDYLRKKFEFNLGDDSNTKLTSDIKYKIHSIGLRLIYKF